MPQFLQNLLPFSLNSPHKGQRDSLLSEIPSLTAEAISRTAGETSLPASFIMGTDSFFTYRLISLLKAKEVILSPTANIGSPMKEHQKREGISPLPKEEKKLIKPIIVKINPMLKTEMPMIFNLRFVCSCLCSVSVRF